MFSSVVIEFYAGRFVLASIILVAGIIFTFIFTVQGSISIDECKFMVGIMLLLVLIFLLACVICAAM